MKHCKKLTLLLIAALLLAAALMTGCTGLTPAQDAPADTKKEGIYVRLERDDAYAVWVVTAFLTVFHVYGVKPTALNLLVFIGFCFVAYTAVAEMRDWFVNSVWSYTSALEDYFSGWY